MSGMSGMDREERKCCLKPCVARLGVMNMAINIMTMEVRIYEQQEI